MKRSCFALVVCMVLTGCSSPPVSTRLYVLDNRIPMPPQVTEDWRIRLGSVQMPEYLDQTSLVTLVGDHELRVARSHVWAERLSQSLPKLLVSDLEQVCACRVGVVVSESSNFSTEVYIVNIDVLQFGPTDQGTVFFSGTYRIRSGAKSETEHRFSLQSEVEDDGFVHAVKTMRKLVQQLADDIHKSILARRS